MLPSRRDGGYQPRGIDHNRGQLFRHRRKKSSKRGQTL
jgi:hypothetical protein